MFARCRVINVNAFNQYMGLINAFFYRHRKVDFDPYGEYDVDEYFDTVADNVDDWSIINPFLPKFPFLYPMKTSVNQVFRGYVNRTLDWNRLRWELMRNRKEETSWNLFILLTLRVNTSSKLSWKNIKPMTMNIVLVSVLSPLNRLNSNLHTLCNN